MQGFGKYIPCYDLKRDNKSLIFNDTNSLVMAISDTALPYVFKDTLWDESAVYVAFILSGNQYPYFTISGKKYYAIPEECIFAITTLDELNEGRQNKYTLEV